MWEYSEDTILLVGAGRQDCSDLHSWGPGMRSVYIIHHILKGAGYVEYGKRKFHVAAGQSFLITPFVSCRYYPDPYDPWEYAWVNFTGLKAQEYLDAIDMNQQHPVCPAPLDRRLTNCYLLLAALDYYYQNKQEANGLLLTILGIYRDTFPAYTSENRSREDNRLTAALTLIHANYHKPDFNIEILCDQLSVNRVTLYRIFKTSLEISPASYLLKYRMEAAQKLLRMGVSVKSTALSCGFEDPFYFSRAFHQYCGMPPSRYGKQ